MAGINDYSNTAGSNTTINGIDIAEGCSPAGINNAIRQLMADIADVDDGVVPLQTPDINGGTIDGAIIGGSSTIDNSIIGGTTPAAGTFTTLTANTSITGTLNTAAQTNITSVGTLTGLTVNGNLSVDGGTIKLDGNYPTGSNNVALGNEAFDAVTTGASNVAIGRASLTALTTGSSNIGIGERALRDLTTGSNNVGIGKDALLLNTASDNTAVGYQSLYLNTSGSSNTATGLGALRNNTTGGNNTAVGYQALTANTTGTPNTALGGIALQDNTTGNDNTAIGYGALADNTTASGNTALGREALRLNVTGASNTALGRSALYNNTASNNTAVGYQALEDNTSGAENTAVGLGALANNTTANDNTAVGRTALNANTTGTENTAVGRDALKNSVTGSNNTAVGSDSLLNNTASNNTAVGYQSLDANTSGSNNVALGYLSLSANTTANDNTALGGSALRENVTGGSNTAIGGGALRNNTASNNTAVGKDALLANTTGARNVAIGDASLDANTTASDITAIGRSSLGANTTGARNTALGQNAGQANTTGQENVYIGQASGFSNTTSDNNTFVGRSAGFNTTGRGNTFLGRESGAAVTTGIKNTIIGQYNGNQGGLDIRTSDNNIVLSDGSGNVRMYIDNAGNVGIGEINPTEALHISSTASDKPIIILENNETGTGDARFYFKHLSASPADNDGLGQIRFIGKNDASEEIYYARFLGFSKDVSDGTEDGEMRFLTYSAGTETNTLTLQSGNVLIGTTTYANTVAGILLQNDGILYVTRDGSTCATINRLSSDGELISFRQANTAEGNISVSGATVSYNGFTGTHWSRLSDNSKPTILKGTILESLDEMMDWYQVQFDITETDDDGNETTRTQKESYALGDGESVGDVITYTYEGTDYQATIIQEGDVKHTKSKISDTVDAKNVYGVFMDWDNDDDTVNDMYVAQTGTFVIRMNSAETVSKGDLIQSNGDGTGKVQSDDIIRSSTVAKVLSTTKIETYEDGSYIVPCSLHC
jgi:hypothetical protein